MPIAELILLNKPFGVLCLFTSTDDRPCLRDFFASPRTLQPGNWAEGPCSRPVRVT